MDFLFGTDLHARKNPYPQFPARPHSGFRVFHGIMIADSDDIHAFFTALFNDSCGTHLPLGTGREASMDVHICLIIHSL